MRDFVVIFNLVCILIYNEESKASLVDIRPWTAPCRQRSSGQLHVMNIIRNQIHIQIPRGNRIRRVQTKIRELADLFQDQFQEYNSSKGQEYLPNERIPSFPLAGFPIAKAAINVTAHISEMNNYLEEDYNGLSRIMIFIEQAQYDAASNQFKNMSTIVTKYREITNKLRDILCDLSQILGGSFASLSHVTRNIMSESMRNVRGFYEEFTRDFIILRNAQSYLASLLPYYNMFRELLH